MEQKESPKNPQKGQKKVRHGLAWIWTSNPAKFSIWLTHDLAHYTTTLNIKWESTLKIWTITKITQFLDGL